MNKLLMKALRSGKAILTTEKIHPDIPTISDVGPCRKVSTPDVVAHLGEGMYKAGPFTFGVKYYEGWTILYGPSRAALAAVGYDFAAVEAAVTSIMEEE